MDTPDTRGLDTDPRPARRLRRRWLLFALIPILAVAATVALPPLDEYAAIDGVGAATTPQGPLDPEVAGPYASPYERPDDRCRTWKINLSEPAAREWLDRFTAQDRGWSRTGYGTGASSSEIPETGMMKKTVTETSSFYNGQTGDRLHIQVDKQETPEPKLLDIRVSVEQTAASREPMRKLSRWYHLLTHR